MDQQIRKKYDFAFLRHDHPSIYLEGNWKMTEDCAIANDMDCIARISLDSVSEIYGVFMTHDWSGKIMVLENSRITDFADLYSHFYLKRVLCLKKSKKRSNTELEIRLIGKNDFSKSCQMTLCGLLVKKDELLPKYEVPGAVELIEDAALQDLATFKQVQQQMSDNCKEAIKARGEKVEDVAKSRYLAYRKRIRTALAYSNSGDRMLDIGAGNIFENMLTDVILPMGIDYWTFDIDTRVVEKTSELFLKLGLDPRKAVEGEYTALPFEDGSFDIVFSSHCIEHSRDLEATFKEIWRVLKPEGHMLLAVPFGWDDSTEHVYTFHTEEWLHLVMRYGFDVLSWQVGKDHPEEGHDLFVVCLKKDDRSGH